MPTYTWQFPALDVYPTHEGLTDVVHAVHWKLTGNSGSGHTATAYGTQALGPADPGNFTPFASLTSSQVQGWVEAQMGAELSACQADIARRINEVIAPTLVQRTPPW